MERRRGRGGRREEEEEGGWKGKQEARGEEGWRRRGGGERERRGGERRGGDRTGRGRDVRCLHFSHQLSQSAGSESPQLVLRRVLGLLGNHQAVSGDERETEPAEGGTADVTTSRLGSAVNHGKRANALFCGGFQSASFHSSVARSVTTLSLKKNADRSRTSRYQTPED